MGIRHSGIEARASSVVRSGLLGAVIAVAAQAVHADTFTVTTTDDAGAGSLRDAIAKANLNPQTADTIAFNLPGPGPHLITPQTPLPELSGPVLIDGYTQPDARPNGEAGGNDAVLQVQLDGSALGFTGVGLVVATDGARVRGLAVNGFSIAGIRVRNGKGARIDGNFIGTHSSGLTAIPNGVGVGIDDDAADTVIGGGDPAARNVISGNTGPGIAIRGASGTRIEGNFIGTDRTGGARLPNGDGIRMFSGKSTAIGGTGAGQRNVISGNREYGIQSTDGSGLRILGNFIGISAAGTAALGNGTEGFLPETTDRGGISLQNETDAVIGQEAAGAANVIAHNGGAGVAVSGSRSIGNAIRGNRIFTNAGLGIDLKADGPFYFPPLAGVTPNDPAPDSDKGPNRFQNFPVLTGVAASATGVVVSGELRSAPEATFRLDFYANRIRDPSGHGEGEFYLGHFDVTTDAKGVASFQVNMPAPPAPWISATATRAGAFADTSEFSPLVARPGGQYGVNNTNPSGPGSLAQAILDSNASGDPTAVNRIVFDVPGLSSYVISPTGVMTVTRAVVIDGSTQPGATPGTPAVGLDGVAVSGPVLNISGDGVTVRGLVFLRHQPATNIAAVQVTGNGNWLKGNLFGLTPGGSPIPNRIAIGLFGADNVVGGVDTIDRNVISANAVAGVALGAGARGNVVQGNLIGTDFTGTQSRGNGDSGVTIAAADQNRVIGNTIAFNAIRGVSVSGTGAGNTISANSMFGNGLGIDLAPTGPNANDAGDADGGTNDGQNHPELAWANILGSVTVAGTLNSTPNAAFRVELFTSPTCSPSGFGEGRTYLGAVGVLTDATGSGKFSTTLPATVTAGHAISTTVTNAAGSTSEFSRCATIATGVPPAGAVAGVLAPATATALTGTTHTVAVSLTAGGAPVANIPVAFAVANGPNAGAGATVIAGSDGRATFGYASDGSSGTDAIVATAAVNGVQVAATGSMTWATTGSAEVVEYYHAGLDHYFITWLPAEIAILDAGETITGWTRTGYGFRAYATAQAGTSPVCRVYIPPELGNSHFFGRGTAECTATVEQNPSFQVEDLQFMQMFLPAAGVCPAGTTQVHRVFSNRQDANHRYMTDKAVRAQMVAKGWLAEGDGPEMVVMCAPH